MTLSYFVDKQQQINEFVTCANDIIGDDPLCYTGHFITGKLTSPDILFVSINPGHSNREDWGDINARRAEAALRDFEPVPIKYLMDIKRGSRYAQRILDVVCGGDTTRLERCAETSFVSYFAAPKESILQSQLAQLPIELQQAHASLTRLNIEQIQPKHILCMGWRAFDRFLEHYGDGSEINVKKLPLMGHMEAYYAHTNVAGVHVHGLRHLCTKLTLTMRANLEQIFSEIWQQIEEDSGEVNRFRS